MTLIEEHVASRPADFVLRTTDPAAVADFYAGLFGWQFDAEGGLTAKGRRVGRAAAGAGGWLPYLAVDDLEVAFKAVREAGGTTSEPVTEAAGRTAVIVEPGGASLGLWQIGSGPGIGVMGESDTVVWVEEKTHDQAADAAFLSAVFGFTVVGPEGPGKVRVLQAGDGPLFAGVMQFDDRWAPDEAPHWLLYFVVADVEATPARAEQLGGSIWFSPFDTPLGRMAYLRDPAGNPFAVVTLSAQGAAMTGNTR